MGDQGPPGLARLRTKGWQLLASGAVVGLVFVALFAWDAPRTGALIEGPMAVVWALAVVDLVVLLVIAGLHRRPVAVGAVVLWVILLAVVAVLVPPWGFRSRVAANEAELTAAAERLMDQHSDGIEVTPCRDVRGQGLSLPVLGTLDEVCIWRVSRPDAPVRKLLSARREVDRGPAGPVTIGLDYDSVGGALQSGCRVQITDRWAELDSLRSDGVSCPMGTRFTGAG